jgi:hypothetical protein
LQSKASNIVSAVFLQSRAKQSKAMVCTFCEGVENYSDEVEPVLQNLPVRVVSSLGRLTGPILLSWDAGWFDRWDVLKMVGLSVR